MRTTSPTAARTQHDFWQTLKDLHFVPDFFSWLFALFSRLAEPLMLLCTLYIVAEAGVPTIALPALHNLAIGILICAPEIILPGSFVVASRAQEHARLLFAVCWTFVALTLLTLISLFVWHFAGALLAWLMCARCAAAVGYSILMRVMSHGQQVNQVTRQMNQQRQEIEQCIAQLSDQVTTQLQAVQSQVREQVQVSQAIMLEQVTAQVQANQQSLAGQVQDGQAAMMERFTGQFAATVQEFKREMRSAIAEAPMSSSPAPARQLRSVAPLVQKAPASEPAHEPVNVRVPRFIQEQVNQGHKPSLREIVEACHCSRNTAIRYRREQLGDEAGVA